MPCCRSWMLPPTLESICNFFFWSVYFTIYVSKQYVLPKPEIPGTAGLYLYGCIYLLAIGLKKISHHITESIVQTPVWPVSHMSHMKDMFQKQKTPYREQVLVRLEKELGHLFHINLQDQVINFFSVFDCCPCGVIFFFPSGLQLDILILLK